MTLEFSRQSTVEAAEAMALNSVAFIREKKKLFPALFAQMPWGEHPSLRDLGFDKTTESFTSITGSPIIQHIDPAFSGFYSQSRCKALTYSVETRGNNYYLSLNPFLNAEDRLKIMTQDYADAVNVLKNIDRNTLDTSGFMQYIGVLDYLKQYSLSLYHAASFHERYGFKLTSEEETIKNMTLRGAVTDTRRFYHALLGQNFDTEDNLDEALKLFTSAATCEAAHHLKPYSFRIQELDHPLIIGAASSLNAIHHPDRTHIVGIPSGSTQLAIATQLAYEQIQGTRPDLALIPYSTYAAKVHTGTLMTDEKLRKMIAVTTPTDAKVLVCEDNTNTGATLTDLDGAFKASGINDIEFAVAEFDPLRVRVKSGFHMGDSITVANLNNKRLQDTAVGIVPITTRQLPNIEMRKLLPLRHIAASFTPNVIEQTDMSMDDYYKITDNPDFIQFKKILRQSLHLAGDSYGYRNMYMAADACYKELRQAGLLEIKDDENWNIFLNIFVGSGIFYPYIPSVIKNKLAESQETATIDLSDSPWLVQGAKNLLQVVHSHIIKYDSTARIWTKGDSHKVGYERLIGCPEQRMRYKISGLERLVGQLDSANDSKILYKPAPNKIKYFEQRVAPKAYKDKYLVVVVDDQVVNINGVQHVCAKNNISCLPIKVGPPDEVGEDIIYAENLLAVTRIIQGLDQPAHYLIDQDDVLLHENFVRRHKPINIFLGINSFLR